MDYQFTMTPRLIAIAVIGFLSLLLLLFALGFQVGQQWEAGETWQQTQATSPSQSGFPLALPTNPAPPTLGIPALPMTAATPTPAPMAGATTPPTANQTGTLAKPN